MKTIKLNLKEQNIFFTSDPHFSHTNIIKYCTRPFKDANHMNEVLIENWNKVVGEKDIVFITGDFCFRSGKSSWVYLLSRLNGFKYLVQGNHDREKDIPFDSFVAVEGMINLEIKGDDEISHGQRITLCHYPMLSWYQSHRGAWQLFGHIHTIGNSTGSEVGYVSSRISSNQYDVGVDQNNFTPLSYEEVKTIITKQNLKKV